MRERLGKVELLCGLAAKTVVDADRDRLDARRRVFARAARRTRDVCEDVEEDLRIDAATARDDDFGAVRYGRVVEDASCERRERGLRQRGSPGHSPVGELPIGIPSGTV